MPMRPPPGRPGNCTTCTWHAPSSLPRCTPGTGRRKRSTPAGSSRAMRAPSSATATRDDGYKGYEHLTDALHAWCGAHGLRDLAGLYRFDPDGQICARSIADLLIDANAQAPAARAAAQASLNDAGLAGIRCSYRGPGATGFTANTG